MRSHYNRQKLFIIFSVIIQTSILISQENCWEPTGGIFSGYVRDFALNSKYHIFAATTHGNFRSEDNGISWIMINNGLSNIGGLSIVVNANDDLFIGTWEGLYKSTDNGANWNYSGASNCVSALAINSKGYIFAAGKGHLTNTIMRSTNNGQTWESLNEKLPGDDISTLAINTNDHIFAGSYGGGLFSSTDHGNTWNSLNANLPNTLIEEVAIRNSGEIFISTFNGIYFSTDNGVSWHSTGFDRESVGLSIRVITFDGLGNIYGGTFGRGIYRSSDNCDNWIEINTGLTNLNVLALNVVSNDALVAGTGEGVFFSYNQGNSWETTGNKGFSNQKITSLVINSNNHIFAGTFGSGLYQSEDLGKTWKGHSLHGSEISSIVFDSKGHIFVGTTTRGLYQSFNNGEEWEKINHYLSTQYINSISIDKNDHIYVATTERPFCSTDNGITWFDIGSEFPSMKNLEFTSVPSGHTFAMVPAHGLYRTADSGDTWVSVNNGLTNLFVKSLVESQDGSLYLAAGGGIFKSLNKGDNWVQVGFLNYNISMLGINSIGHIFAGIKYHGIFRSTDQGKKWEKIKDVNIFESTGVSAMAFDTTGFLLIGTEGRGVYKSIFSTIEKPESFEEKPSSFILKQNYPNPFNSSTTILFNLPKSEHVTLTIYNLNGQRVTTLLNDDLTVGEHKIKWNPQEQASGIYFFRLKAGSFSETKKLILQK